MDLYDERMFLKNKVGGSATGRTAFFIVLTLWFLATIIHCDGGETVISF